MLIFISHCKSLVGESINLHVTDMADISVEDHLRSWGLEMYIEKFKEHAIDLNVLLLLSQDDIKDLIPIIGHRALLTTQLKTLKDIINSPVIILPSPESSEVKKISLNEPVSLQDISLTNLLNDSSLAVALDKTSEPENEGSNLREHLMSINEGKALLLQFESVGLLDNSARRKLCNIIINRELQNDPNATITSQRFYQLAFDITKIFKRESAPVYFTPYVCLSPAQKIAAKGKLLDTYRQRRREYSKSGLITQRKRSASSTSSCYSGLDSPQPRTSISALRVEEAARKLPDPSTEAAAIIDDNLLWLKNSCDPWINVQLYWDQTRKVRLQRFAETGMSIADYFNEFRALRQSGGLHLLLDDFNHLYPDLTNKLFENWPLHRDGIIQVARQRRDPVLQDILSCLDVDNVTEETINTAAFMALAFLMTTSTIRKPKMKKQWRPSRIEALQGFITHVKTPGDLETVITLRKEKMASLGFTIQPYIILIGASLNQITSRHIVINNVTADVKYNSTSITHAVDSCFKIMFALNAEYPIESANIWYFIQKAIFKMSTKYDKVYTTVNSLMTDLGMKLT